MTSKLLLISQLGAILLFATVTLAPSLSFGVVNNATNTTILDKNFQSCYKIVTQAMIQANPSNPMLKYAFTPVPIPSFKAEVIQNLTQPVHLKMFGQENIAGESLVKQVADCMKLMK
ncbi:MAG: hypothetical protein M3P08_11065 [Thermoproteota archaeon]|nr:hypothetical protein [Thermoproteota archaeon]